MRQFFTILIAFASLILMLLGNNALRNENQRLMANNEALQSEMKLYRTRLGKSAASVAELHLTLSELRDRHADALCEIESMELKLRRVKSYAESVARTTIVETLHLEPQRDTAIHNDGIATTPLRWSVDYHDGHIAISGEVWRDTLSLNIESIDTLRQVVHRIPRRFLGIPYGTKYLRQEITSSNPHTTLIYSEYITIDRRIGNKKW